jgi:outer membrane lipoprotein carrier protein
MGRGLRAGAGALLAACQATVPAALAATVLLGVPLAAAAASDTALDHFLDGLASLRAEFSQTVVDASGQQVDAGKGSLLVRRPGRFRWEYAPRDSGAQLLVADGRNLWFLDRELQQATVKPAAAALSATPVVLLSGSAAEVRAAFEISAGAARENLDWVQVTPRSSTADFASAELGFSGTQLARLLIHDRLGQTVTLTFTHSARNARVSDAEVSFSPPAGVDVIGTAQPP